MKKVSLAIVAAIVTMMGVSQQANATDYWHTSTIKWIYPQQDGAVILTFNTEHASCTNPSSPKQYVIRVGQNSVTTDGVKSILAVAMLAMSLGKQLAINFSDTTTSCYINRAYVIN